MKRTTVVVAALFLITIVLLITIAPLPWKGREADGEDPVGRHAVPRGVADGSTTDDAAVSATDPGKVAIPVGSGRIERIDGPSSAANEIESDGETGWAELPRTSDSFVACLFSAPQRCTSARLLRHLELNPRDVELPVAYRQALAAVLVPAVTALESLTRAQRAVESREFQELIDAGMAVGSPMGNPVIRMIAGREVAVFESVLPRYHHPGLGQEMPYKVTEFDAARRQAYSARLSDMPGARVLWRQKALASAELGCSIVAFFELSSCLNADEAAALKGRIRQRRDSNLKR